MAKNELGISIETLYRRMVVNTAQEFSYSRKGKLSLPQWQKALRGRLVALLGIEGKPRPAPKVRIVEKVACDGYFRSRGYMVAQDELAVPFYLLEPDPIPAPAGVCIAGHGHGPGKTVSAGIITNEDSRQQIEEGEYDYAVQAVRRGYIAIAPDWRGFGELVLDQDCADNRPGCWQLACRAVQLGRPLLGQRVSDAMQLLDWALARKDVDPNRVVITGNSGGGTMTLFTSAVDERIRSAAPSCYFSTFADSIMNLWHCPCNFVPGLQGVAEMADLAGLFAPKPMLVVAGTLDPIFPIDAVRAGFAALKRIYADTGAANRLEFYEGSAGHRFYSNRVWDFFEEQLAV
jgi:dienelactone hydrolase